MYRCKDCQKEYSQKVEYCDCGNNTFDYIEDAVVPKTTAREPFTAKEKSAIVSQIFFLVCLILSVVVWIIPVKTQTPVEEKPAPKVTEIKAFPSIDKIWNSTPPKQKLPAQTTQLPTVPEPVAIATSTPIQPIQRPAQTKPAQTQTKPSTTQKPQTQTKPAATQTKPTQTQTKPAPQAQTKPTTQTQTKPAPQTQTKPAQTTSPTQTRTSSQAKPQTQTKPAQTSTPQTSNQTPVKQETKTYNSNSFEMLKYKGELRSAMFKKLPVGSIQGSGTCSVQFSVDPTGKLINRSFAQKSDNKTINDAVYYMMMSVPRFNPPPTGYNGSLIKMYFKFYDGSYEISIY